MPQWRFLPFTKYMMAHQTAPMKKATHRVIIEAGILPRLEPDESIA